MPHIPAPIWPEIYDLHGPSADETAKTLGVQRFGSKEEIITSDDVDAVLTATPTATHVDQLDACVNTGKPVLCEKPIDLPLARVNGLKERIADTNVPIMLGFEDGRLALLPADACFHSVAEAQTIKTSALGLDSERTQKAQLSS